MIVHGAKVRVVAVYIGAQIRPQNEGAIVYEEKAPCTFTAGARKSASILRLFSNIVRHDLSKGNLSFFVNLKKCNHSRYRSKGNRNAVCAVGHSAATF